MHGFTAPCPTTIDIVPALSNSVNLLRHNVYDIYVYHSLCKYAVSSCLKQLIAKKIVRSPYYSQRLVF